DAIRDDRAIADPKLAALAAFTAKMVSSRGCPSDFDVAQFRAAGYSERNVLGIILAISVKTLSNYTNHVFHTPVDGFFAGRAW
ncbi:carboxymuconolactone decarboxylase family protein, partial [Acinetobacter baumannii]